MEINMKLHQLKYLNESKQPIFKKFKTSGHLIGRIKEVWGVQLLILKI